MTANSLAEIAALAVAFVSLQDNLDLSTPSGRLMVQIIGAMAEWAGVLQIPNRRVVRTDAYGSRPNSHPLPISSCRPAL